MPNIPNINDIPTRNTTIGVNIRYTRLLKNMSEDDLAHHVGVKSSYIHQCEAGQIEVLPPLLQDIANVLGVSVSSIVNTKKRAPACKKSYLSKALEAINHLENFIEGQQSKAV
ncbi:helix-turn-helix transcriptional regulator [uncultured Kiloniella sp.]|uniref:helix-turn-helix domain-containing protein n=1 Tax=uncultured Kiloniella sp. TaxID=1133091 RepID=UPI0026022980|nr:helix-turn-helix transcriptional regulator [uncultured Kiloniella sp.]